MHRNERITVDEIENRSKMSDEAGRGTVAGKREVGQGMRR